MSTIPLVELGTIAGLSEGGLSFSSLEWTSLLTFDIVFDVKGDSPRPESTWIYSYEPDSSIARVSFPDNFTSRPLANNKFRVQAEQYFWGRGDTVSEVSGREALEFVRRHELVPADWELFGVQMSRHKYANIVPTVQTAAVVREIREHFLSLRIFTAGRYGAWKYLWSVESAKSGKKAAELAAHDFTS